MPASSPMRVRWDQHSHHGETKPRSGARLRCGSPVNFATPASSSAIGLASDAGQVSPAHAILNDGARSFLRLGQLQLAQALADLVLSEDERSADALSVVANIRDRQGDWPDSLAYLRRAHAGAPHAPQVRLNLGLALLRLGEYRAGFALYEVGPCLLPRF